MSRRVLVGAVVLLAGCGGQSGGDSGGGTGGERDDPPAAYAQEWADALVNRDAAKVCALMTESATFEMGSITGGVSSMDKSCEEVVPDYLDALGDEKQDILARTEYASTPGGDDAATKGRVTVYPPEGEKAPVLQMERVGDVWKVALLPDPAHDF